MALPDGRECSGSGVIAGQRSQHCSSLKSRRKLKVEFADSLMAGAMETGFSRSARNPPANGLKLLRNWYGRFSGVFLPRPH